MVIERAHTFEENIEIKKLKNREEEVFKMKRS